MMMTTLTPFLTGSGRFNRGMRRCGPGMMRMEISYTTTTKMSICNPDYEEPFLRFRSDRPEFFFGLDMNHNGVVDRFEDDDLPDYPFERDLRGFNSYLSANIGPDVKLLVGRQHMRRLSGDGHTRSWYTLLAGMWRSAGGGCDFSNTPSWCKTIFQTI